MNENIIVEAIKKSCKRHGDQKALAEQIGVSTSYLSEVMNGLKQPNPLIAAHFGYELVYRKIRK